MFQEEKKLLAELKVLRSQLLEIDNLLDKSKEKSRVNDVIKLEERKDVLEHRVKEIEILLYSDITA